MSIDIYDLEDWSNRAAQALQDFCDEAQIDAGDPDGEHELQDIRELLKEHTLIVSGEGFLLHKLNSSETGDVCIAALEK